MHQRNTTALLIAVAIAPTALAQNVEVIYSKVDASTTSDIAGTLDLAGLPAASKWRAIEDFTVRPDGGNWVVKGRTRLGGDLETILVRGAGASGTMFCQEGQPVQGAAAGELYDFFDTPNPVSYDAAGNIGFSFRARGGATTDNEKVMTVFGGVHTQVLQQSDLYTGLVDVPANPQNDETVGNSIGSVTLLDNGQVFFGNTPIGNCHSSRYPAIFRGTAAFRQSGISAIGGEVWDSLDYDGCGGSSNPAHWFAVGDTENTNTAIDKIMAVNDVIVLQEGSPVGGSSLNLGDITQASMAYDGTWAARGRDNSGTSTAAPDWAVRNGVVIAKTGDSVDGGVELWGDSLYAVAVNSSGDWAVAGRTNNVNAANDDVVVVNGVVVMREGDPIDLNGNGLFDDDAFIGRGVNTNAAFAANDLALTEDGYVWAIVQLRNGAGADLNNAGFGTPDAFVRKRVGGPAPTPFCFGDGTGAACPCGNTGSAGNGCANSVVAAGGNIAASGTSSISADSLLLSGSGMPNSSALYFQGTTQLSGGLGAPFGDGLRCASGSVIRLSTKFNVAGASQFPDVGDPSVSVRGLVVAAGVRTYQVWYRNAAAFCTSDTFNLTNGVEVTWVP